MKNFVPKNYQTKLNKDQFIIENAQVNPEAVPMDVIFVGAGPAGLSGAIRLAQLIKEDTAKGGTLGEIQIGVLEKSANLGGHILSGAVMNPTALKNLFPDIKDDEFPQHGKVKGDAVYFLTEGKHVRIPTPPTMHNSGNYVVSLCEMVRFLGKKAEELGINLFTSFPADSLLTEGDKIIGVRTTPAGLNRESQPGAQYMPPTDITAKVTVLSEGTRGPLAQAYCSWQSISRKTEQIFALGVKEIWKVKKVPDHVVHTMGYPLADDTFGGSFLYPMDDDKVAFGLVAGLDYQAHNVDVHRLLQKLKNHPLFKQYLEGGDILEWGAKTIPEGGWNALPDRLHGNGLLMTGDTAGFVNVPALKGIHYAMQSGILAAETIFASLKKNDTTAATLSEYDQKIRSSFIYDELYKVRNMRHAFKDGFVAGGIKAGLMTITGGAFPGGGSVGHDEDAAEMKYVSANTEAPVTTGGFNISKVDGVYRSGNKTRDDIPSHLTVGKDIPPDVADMYVAMCPAGVYERRGDQLVVNAPNCVDCKATDILGPRWQPREGGAGPDYQMM